MKPTRDSFMAQPQKSITLIGMSGLGKTYTAMMLARHGWVHYSCDVVIGVDHLAGVLDARVTADDLSPLSRFIGRPGDPAKGGLPLDEFKRRQKMYYDAECAALRGVGPAIAGAGGRFVNDSTGSLCEINDAVLIDALGAQTLFVYIRANADEEEKIKQRAIAVPKPLFFPPAQFDQWLNEFMQHSGINDPSRINPDDFSRYVFPLLFKSRLPKYQALADRHGVTIASESMADIKSEDDFIDCIAGVLQP